MSDKEKLTKQEATFELEAWPLKLTDVLKKLSCWDSMATLSLIVLRSDNFNKKTNVCCAEHFRHSAGYTQLYRVTSTLKDKSLCQNFL